ncbi:uncharacterized protein CLUP02_02525 [Colletotrichum lupini]|uniref:Uncharacterized protein n=1 Tax=Colletotrichum lupini TaxID=145971 RepID=A0A9Q8SGP2_9PEZI|nr:uncharacterized protein CLUP02_02525 [Colletotrichum lupini]UQC77059.1 hypothetical protein CLUP02_02525 [Colletotrichum lupini]
MIHALIYSKAYGKDSSSTGELQWISMLSLQISYALRRCFVFGSGSSPCSLEIIHLCYRPPLNVQLGIESHHVERAVANAKPSFDHSRNSRNGNAVIMLYQSEQSPSRNVDDRGQTDDRDSDQRVARPFQQIVEPFRVPPTADNLRRSPCNPQKMQRSTRENTRTLAWKTPEGIKCQPALASRLRHTLVDFDHAANCQDCIQEITGAARRLKSLILHVATHRTRVNAVPPNRGPASPHPSRSAAVNSVQSIANVLQRATPAPEPEDEGRPLWFLEAGEQGANGSLHLLKATNDDDLGPKANGAGILDQWRLPSSSIRPTLASDVRETQNSFPFSARHRPILCLAKLTSSSKEELSATWNDGLAHNATEPRTGLAQVKAKWQQRPNQRSRGKKAKTAGIRIKLQIFTEFPLLLIVDDPTESCDEGSIKLNRGFQRHFIIRAVTQAQPDRRQAAMWLVTPTMRPNCWPSRFLHRISNGHRMPDLFPRASTTFLLFVEASPELPVMPAVYAAYRYLGDCISPPVDFGKDGKPTQQSSINVRQQRQSGTALVRHLVLIIRGEAG